MPIAVTAVYTLPAVLPVGNSNIFPLKDLSLDYFQSNIHFKYALELDNINASIDASIIE